MSKMIAGYSCPICELLMSEPQCPRHPELYADIALRECFYLFKTGNEPLQIFHRDDDEGIAEVTCQMAEDHADDDDHARSVRAALEACKGMSTKALERGVIQAMELLAAAIQDYFQSPSPLKERDIYKLLGALKSRARD